MTTIPDHPGISATLRVVTTLHRGVASVTFDQFSQATVKITGEMKDALQSYQRFKSNPLQWLAECQPRELAVEIVEVLLEKGVSNETWP
jgi:hypothetical protein